MKMGKKQLGCLIGIFVIILVIVGVLIFLGYGQEKKETDISAETGSLTADPTVWDGLASRQQANGSWDNDLETTMIASNALTQSVELMDSDENNIDWQRAKADVNTSKVTNTEAVEDAQDWTFQNYQQDAPLEAQNSIQYHVKFLMRQDYIDEGNMTSLSQQTSDVVLSYQSNDGSWNSNVQQTSFSVYVLKKFEPVNTKAVKAGEDWLIAQQENGSWGSVKNDTFALLALHNTSMDMSEVIESVIASQDSNGSIGDLETTAWATIALSLYDTPSSHAAASHARHWLLELEQENLSDRELALVSLAESEYLTSEVIRLGNISEVKTGKGPPVLLFSIMVILAGVIIVLIILFLRLGEGDAFAGVRQDIYDYIKDHPGVNQNALKRRLDISSSSIRHHLKILERYEHILQHNDGKYIRYYVNKNGYSLYTNGNGYKEIISVLRKDTAANIVRHIQEHPNTTQRHLAKALNLHPSTIHWHTKLLLASNIISVKRTGKSIRYEINEPMDIDRLLALAN